MSGRCWRGNGADVTDRRREEDSRGPDLYRVRERAVGFFGGDEEAAREWMSSPLAVLGDRTPAEIARTEAGARRVEAFIEGLESGVFF